MIFLSADGNVTSINNDTTFGWWFSDILKSVQNDDITVHKVKSTDIEIVSEEVCKCCKGNKNLVYEPVFENIVDYLDLNKCEDQLLFNIFHPNLFNQNDYSGPKIEDRKVLTNHSENVIDECNFGMIKKLNLCSNESIENLHQKFKKLDVLLDEIKLEVSEMHYSLQDLRQSNFEEENYIEDLIHKTAIYTQDISNKKFLNNIILLLNNELCDTAVINWPFYIESTVAYSKTERNYII